MARCGKCKKVGVDAAHVRACYLGTTTTDDGPLRVEGGEFRGRGTVLGIPSDADEARDMQARERAEDERVARYKADRDARMMASNGSDDDDRAAVVLDRMAPSDDHVDRPTEKQLGYVASLLAEREWPTTYDEADLKAMTRQQVSRLIDGLIKAPRTSKPTSAMHPGVYDGRYAIDREGTLRFYQVDRPVSGRWQGYVFVAELFGAPGDWRREPIKNRVARESVLNQIEADVRGAAARFGHEFVTCGMCGSPLSLKRSRTAGYGEKCAANNGWPW